MSIRRLWLRATAAGRPGATAAVRKETQPLKPALHLVGRATHIVGRAFDIVVDTGAFAATWLVAAMALTIGLEVLMRRVFNNSLPWVIQINEYFVMAIPFLAGAWLLKHDGHTRLTLIMERVSPRKANLMRVGTSVLAAAICAVLVWKTGSRVWEGFEADTIIRGDSFNIHQWRVWWVLPFGFALLGIQFLRDAYSSYSERNRVEGPVVSPSEFAEI